MLRTIYLSFVDKLSSLTKKVILRLFPELCIVEKNIQNTSLGRTTVICTPSDINSSIVGDYSYISSNSMINNTDIGKYCSIGPNFLCGWGIHPIDGTSTSPLFYSFNTPFGFSYSEIDKVIEKKRITIGNDVFIGANVTVLDGITIGDGAVIGAGAVVSKDIPPYAVAVGCPIEVIRYRFPDKIREQFIKLQWWNFSEENIRDVEKFFSEPEKLLEQYK